MDENEIVPKKIYLIINADDFGLSAEINEGIIDAFKNGVVTSVSLMVNEGEVDDAVKKIRQNTKLNVGLHLNIFKGEALSPLKYLINKKGGFKNNIFSFSLNCLLRKKAISAEIYQEFESQIKKALALNINPSHLDTEKHIHILPFIFKILISLAEKYNIPAVRFPHETFGQNLESTTKQKIKVYLSTIFSKKNKKILKKSKIKSPDFFYGISISDKYSKNNFIKLIDQLKPGVNELSCHPGLPPKEVKCYIDKSRQKELEILTNNDIKNYINAKNINLIDFNFLKYGTRHEY